MTGRVLTCMRCGYEGTDVSVALVDLDREARAEGKRVRTVEVEIVTELRHVEVRDRREVPELYGTEWRCRDRAGCDERYQALTWAAAEEVLDAPAKPADDQPSIEEERVSWM